jgi:hypothetical protein
LLFEQGEASWHKVQEEWVEAITEKPMRVEAARKLLLTQRELEKPGGQVVLHEMFRTLVEISEG